MRRPNSKIRVIAFNHKFHGGHMSDQPSQNVQILRSEAFFLVVPTIFG